MGPHISAKRRLQRSDLLKDQSPCSVQAEAALRRAEIVRWLCTAPAAPKQAASGDPAALMHQLRLGRDSRPAALHPRHATHQVRGPSLLCN